MENFVSIRRFSRDHGVPEGYVRALVKNGTCPGFYSGVKFIVYAPGLLAQLEGRDAEQGVSDHEE